MTLATAVAKRLKPLLEDLVFVGGCAAGLLITDPASAPVRATRDVDVMAELGSYAEYSILGEKLRELGFAEDTRESAPLCRWVIDEMCLDVMPTDAKLLGFTNLWYSAAMQDAITFELAPDLRIRLVSAPYFLATKLEAFEARGSSDVYTSHDLEDILLVIDGRSEIVAESQVAPLALRRFLASKFR